MLTKSYRTTVPKTASGVSVTNAIMAEGLRCDEKLYYKWDFNFTDVPRVCQRKATS